MSSELLTIIVSSLVAAVSAPIGAWVNSKILRQKYDIEIGQLKAEMQKKLSDVKDSELENVRKASEGGGENCHFELPDGKGVSDVRDAIFAALPEGATCETQTVGDITLFFVRFDADTVSCFMLREAIRRDVEDAPPRYCLSNMIAETPCGDVVFPYQLCPDERQGQVGGESGCHFLFGKETDISLDYAACKQFYASLGRDYITFDDEEQSITLPHMVGNVFDRRMDEESAIKMTIGEKLLFEKVDL